MGAVTQLIFNAVFGGHDLTAKHPQPGFSSRFDFNYAMTSEKYPGLLV
jgi:hypothetical protein